MTTATNTITPKVGDILSCSWGYDQTNVDFYKVVKLSPSGKSVTIMRIKSAVKENGYMSGESTPAVPHTFRADAKPLTKRVNSYEGSYCVTMNSYSTAFLWDGKPRYTSWYA